MNLGIDESKGFLDYLCKDDFVKHEAELRFCKAKEEVSKQVRFSNQRKKKLNAFFKEIDALVGQTEITIRDYSSSTKADKMTLLIQFIEHNAKHFAKPDSLNQRMLLLKHLGVLNVLAESINMTNQSYNYNNHEEVIRRNVEEFENTLVKLLAFLFNEKPDDLLKRRDYIGQLLKNTIKDKTFLADLIAERELANVLMLKGEISIKIDNEIIELKNCFLTK